MSEAPATYGRFKATHPELAEAYERLSTLTGRAGPLSEREQRLIRLGVAMGTRNPGAIRSALRKAGDAGVGVEELRHAVLLGLVNVGISDTLMVMAWVDELSGAAAQEGNGSGPR